MNTKNKETIHAVVSDAQGNPKYHIDGKYSDKFVLKNLETREEKVVWTAPSYPENHHLQYGMNRFSLQMNNISDKLISQLPPTDTRLRKDMRLWEEGLGDQASEIKAHLENNQRERKKAVKEILGDKMGTGDDV